MYLSAVFIKYTQYYYIISRNDFILIFRRQSTFTYTTDIIFSYIYIYIGYKIYKYLSTYTFDINTFDTTPFILVAGDTLHDVK